MNLRFTPVKSFSDGDNQYIAGMGYSVRDGNDVLARKVTDWIGSGKVRAVSAGGKGTGPAVLRGHASTNVKESKKEKS